MTEKRGRGRPNEYDPKFCDEVNSYLALCEDEYDEFHATRGLKSDGYQRIIKVNLPTREGFADHIDRSTDAFLDWERAFPEFSGAMMKLDYAQKVRLINMGLSGDYNPKIAGLLLSANHGMREKTEQDITSGGKPITVVTKVPDGGGDSV